MEVFYERPIVASVLRPGDAKPLAGWTHPRLKAKFKITVKSISFLFIHKKKFFKVSTIFILSMRIYVVSYVNISYLNL